MSQERSSLSGAASRAVLAAAPEGIFVVDREGRIVLVNVQTEELFGYAPKELLGHPFQVLFPEGFRDEHDQQISGYNRTPGLRPGRAGLELRGLHKEGASLPLELTVNCVEADGVPYVCCVIRRIAGQRQPDHALRELEDRFRLMVENSHDILTVRNADGRIRYTSPSFHRVMGYKQEEMIGSTGFDLLHPEDRPKVESAPTEFWKTPGARDSIQYRARHANGTWDSLEVTAYNLLDHPVVRGVVINGRDISERKREEDARDQLIADLEHTLANLETLTGVLRICASCKKVQNASGTWQQIEMYIRDRSQVEFSHGMCPECARLWFPDHYKQ